VLNSQLCMLQFGLESASLSAGWSGWCRWPVAETCPLSQKSGGGGPGMEDCAGVHLGAEAASTLFGKISRSSAGDVPAAFRALLHNTHSKLRRGVLGIR
jgi:hypothetical protein